MLSSKYKRRIQGESGMPQIENWPRVLHRNLECDAVERELEEKGRAEIAKWRYQGTSIRCVHIYEPNRAKPFKVELQGIDLDLPEEGRYETREAGGEANKRLMRQNIHLPGSYGAEQG